MNSKRPYTEQKDAHRVSKKLAVEAMLQRVRWCRLSDKVLEFGDFTVSSKAF